MSTQQGSYNTYIGARYVPIFDGQWDNTKAYEPLVIVEYQGNSYTSKTYVPIGADINNTDYWALTGNYNAQVEAYRQQVQQYQETVETFDNRITNNSNNIDSLEKASFLQTHKFAFMGDSVMYGQVALNGEQAVDNIPATFKNITNCPVSDNLAIMGTTMCSSLTVPTEARNNSFVNLTKSIDFTKYDYVIVAYGINDFAYNCEIGNINSLNELDFYGAMNVGVNNILSKNPNCRIVFTTPIYHKWNDDNINSGALTHVWEYCQAIKNICRKYELKCIDLFNSLGINNLNYSSYYWDLTHPTNNTYKYIGEFISKSFSINSSVTNYKEPVYDVHPNNLIYYADFPVTTLSNIFTDKLLEQTTVNKFENATTTVLSTLRKYYFKAGETYTFSFSAKNLATVTNSLIQFDVFSNKSIVLKQYALPIGESTQVICFTIPSDFTGYANIRLVANDVNLFGDLYTSNYCLYHGINTFGYQPPFGSPINSNWHDLTLLNSDTGTYCCYLYEPSGFINIQGLFRPSTTPFATVPDLYKPNFDVFFQARNLTKNTDVTIGIYANGTIGYISGVDPNDQIDLNCRYFARPFNITTDYLG